MAAQVAGRRTAGTAELEQEADQVAALSGRHRGGQAVGHQRAVLSDVFDVGLGDLKSLARGRVAEHQLVGRSRDCL